MKIINLKVLFIAIAGCSLSIHAFANCRAPWTAKHVVSIKNYTGMPIKEVNYVHSDDGGEEIKPCGSLNDNGKVSTQVFDSNSGRQFVEAKINDRLSCQTQGNIRRVGNINEDRIYDVVIRINDGRLECNYLGSR